MAWKQKRLAMAPLVLKRLPELTLLALSAGAVLETAMETVVVLPEVEAAALVRFEAADCMSPQQSTRMLALMSKGFF